VLDRHRLGRWQGAVNCACGKEAEPGSETCFRCRVATVGFGFRGGGLMYGRKNFSERTNAEYIAEHIGDTSGAAHMGSQEWQG
jgi:hypothetical protein